MLVLAVIALAIYALRQRRKAAQAFLAANPFGNLSFLFSSNLFYLSPCKFRVRTEDCFLGSASWDVTSRGDSGDVPKLKGTRVYSLQELKLATNNFSMDNEIGSGGYGKVQNLLWCHFTRK